MRFSARLFIPLATIVGLLPSFDVPASAATVYNMAFPVVGENTFSDTFGAPRCCGRTHEGIDIMSDKLTPVVAVADGTVGWVSSSCCAMALNHDDGWSSWYIHLNNDRPGTDDGLGIGFAPGIQSGVHVVRGQLLGWVGDSGNAEGTAPHLHFELHDPDDSVINPFESLLAAQSTQPVTFPQQFDACDFNNDGYDDIPTGVPGDGSDGPDAGAVIVRTGDSSGPSGQPMVLKPGGPGGEFGTSWDCGDFDDDGFDDLAIGAPSANNGAGRIHIFAGSSSGLSEPGIAYDASSSGFPGAKEGGDLLGWALASGDFNGDGHDDLAVGAPGEDVAGIVDIGAVTILYGSSSGLSTAGNVFSQRTSGVAGAGEAGDYFGFSLESLDANGDGIDDLAVGIPYEDVGSQVDAGSVQLLLGTGSGLGFAGDRLWSQATSGIRGSAEGGDLFGYDLSAADTDQDGRDDLVVGVPGEDVGAVEDAGYVMLIRGGAAGLTATFDRGWHQGSTGVVGTPESGDLFGENVAAADFGGDGFVDIAVGTPGEGVGQTQGSGSVIVLSGGLFYFYDARSSTSITQSFPGVPGIPESGDGFGAFVGAGDLDDDGIVDLAIGSPGEDISGSPDAGYVVLMSLVDWDWSVATNLNGIEGLTVAPDSRLGVVNG